jgi:hypothetical protein
MSATITSLLIGFASCERDDAYGSGASAGSWMSFHQSSSFCDGTLAEERSWKWTRSFFTARCVLRSGVFAPQTGQPLNVIGTRCPDRSCDRLLMSRQFHQGKTPFAIHRQPVAEWIRLVKIAMAGRILLVRDDPGRSRGLSAPDGDAGFSAPGCRGWRRASRRTSPDGRWARGACWLP